MSKNQKLPITILGIITLVLILIFIFYNYNFSKKNSINLDNNKNEIENVCNNYLDLLNKGEIDEAVKILYFKPEYEYHIDYFKDALTNHPSHIEEFKINDIIQINKYVCQLKSTYIDNNQKIEWEPYIAKIDGVYRIIQNPRFIPNKYIKNIIIENNENEFE